MNAVVDMAQDYYDILGVGKDADEAELKKAYRKLAMQYHPDRNPGDEAAEKKFKEINEAYDVLKDPQKRAAYNQFGHSAFEGGGAPGAGAGGFDFSGSFADIFDDLFGEFTGGRRGHAGAGAAAGASRGADLRYNLDISLEDAFKGKQQNIKEKNHHILQSPWICSTRVSTSPKLPTSFSSNLSTRR